MPAARQFNPIIATAGDPAGCGCRGDRLGLGKGMLRNDLVGWRFQVAPMLDGFDEKNQYDQHLGVVLVAML